MFSFSKFFNELFGYKPSLYEETKKRKVIEHIQMVKDEIGDFEGRLDQAIFLLGLVRVKGE